MEEAKSLQQDNAMELGETVDLNAGKAEASIQKTSKTQVDDSKTSSGNSPADERIQVAGISESTDIRPINDANKLNVSHPDLNENTAFAPDPSVQTVKDSEYWARLRKESNDRESLMKVLRQLPIVSFDALAVANIQHLHDRLIIMNTFLHDSGYSRDLAAEQTQVLNLDLVNSTLQKYSRLCFRIHSSKVIQLNICRYSFA